MRFAHALPMPVFMAGCRPAALPAGTGTATCTETSALRTPPMQARKDIPPRGPRRYNCRGDHRVDIVPGGDNARITPADGRVADVRRVPDSAPPRHAGAVLPFEVGSNAATLGQDETGGFSCREAG